MGASRTSQGDIFQLVGPAKPLQLHPEFGCLFSPLVLALKLI